MNSAYGLSSMKESKVKKPAEAVRFADSCYRAMTPNDPYRCWYFIGWAGTILSTNSSSSVCEGHLHHSGGMNLAFLDGHVVHASRTDLLNNETKWFAVTD